MTITVPAEPDHDTSSILPPGIYTVRVKEAEETTSSKGTPGIRLVLSCDHGEIWDYIYITPKTVTRVRGILTALGHPPKPGASELDPGTLVGSVAEIVVDTDEYNGNTRSRVTTYTPTSTPATSRPRPNAAKQNTALADDDIPF